MPIESTGKRNSPFSSVVVVRVAEVLRLVAFKATPETAAPDASMTMPSIEPSLPDWPLAVRDQASASEQRRAALVTQEPIAPCPPRLSETGANERDVTRSSLFRNLVGGILSLFYRQLDPSQKFRESRIRPQWIEPRSKREQKQVIVVLRISLLHPRECLVFLTEGRVNQCNLCRGDVVCPGLLLQLGKDAPRVSSLACSSVDASEVPEVCLVSRREFHSQFEFGDSLRKFSLRLIGKANPTVGLDEGRVQFERLLACFYCLVVLASREIPHCHINCDDRRERIEFLRAFVHSNGFI